MIGLLVEDAANPFSASLMRAVEDVARQREVRVLIGSLDEDPDRERELARELIDRRVDGLVIVPAAAITAIWQRSVTPVPAWCSSTASLSCCTRMRSFRTTTAGRQTAVVHLLEHGSPTHRLPR